VGPSPGGAGKKVLSSVVPGKICKSKKTGEDCVARTHSKAKPKRPPKKHRTNPPQKTHPPHPSQKKPYKKGGNYQFVLGGILWSRESDVKT